MLSFNRSRINSHDQSTAFLSLSLFEGWWSGTGGGGASRGEEGGGAKAAHHQRARHGERRQWQVVGRRSVHSFIHSFIHSLVDCGVLLLQILFVLQQTPNGKHSASHYTFTFSC